MTLIKYLWTFDVCSTFHHVKPQQTPVRSSFDAFKLHISTLFLDHNAAAESQQVPSHAGST